MSAVVITPSRLTLSTHWARSQRIGALSRIIIAHFVFDYLLVTELLLRTQIAGSGIALEEDLAKESYRWY